MKRYIKLLTVAALIIIVGLIYPSVAKAASVRKDGTIVGTTCWITRSESGYQGSKKVVTIPKGQKLKILGEKSSKFLVNYNKKDVYISNAYVLINVKEYIPSIDLRIDMAQKENLFNMGDERIPGVSDQRFYSIETDEAAWLRYAVATKLLSAQKAFNKDGYGIVIYDAYRPYSVTCKIRDNFKAYLKKKSSSFKSNWFGKLGESWFLAQGVSAHNYGRAVDMSLQQMEDGELLEMPSEMHTLDKRAAYYTWCNNTNKSARNAKYLKTKMESVGFTYLQSEWWHFQVNNITFGSVIDLKL